MSIKFKVDAKGLDFDLAKERIEVECPDCKTQNTVTLEQVKNQEHVKCIKCGITLALKDADRSVGKTIRNVNNAFDEMKDALRDLGD